MSRLPAGPVRAVCAAALLAAACSGSSGEPRTPGSLEPISLGRAPDPGLRSRIDALVQPLVDEGWIVGAAIAAIDDDQVLFMGYGRVAADDTRRPSPDTVFEIGALGDVFTGLLLGDRVAREELSLETPILELFPDGFAPPGHPAGAVTLEHLATHTAGLPDLPPNLGRDHRGASLASAIDLQNPFADYTAARLYEALLAWEPAAPPGQDRAYSTMGASLLGHILARDAGGEYPELIGLRIGKPLGMTSTTAELSAGQLERLAHGHTADGDMVSSWEFPGLPEAGGLRSTTRDLTELLRAHIDLEPPAVANAVQVAEAGRHPLADGGSAALGWQVDGGLRWQVSRTGGYGGFLAYDRGDRVGLVILSNTATRAVVPLAHALLDLLRRRPARLELPRIRPVDAEILARHTGTYGPLTPSPGGPAGDAGGTGRSNATDQRSGRSDAEDDPTPPLRVALVPGSAGLPFALRRAGSWAGVRFTLAVVDDQLVARIADWPPVRLYPASDTEFHLRVVDARIRFDRTGLELVHAGATFRAERVSSR